MSSVNAPSISDYVVRPDHILSSSGIILHFFFLAPLNLGSIFL